MSVGDFFAALYERYENADSAFTVYGPTKGPFSADPTIRRWEETVQGQKDIYFRLCPVWEPPPQGKRGDSTYTCALCFTWLDIDCGIHKSGKKYFPTKEEAIAWVKKVIPWSFIVDSGTGLHVYCVLSEPLYLERNDDESLKRAYELSWRFQQWAREMCPYEIDSTHDLARVLRVPGTIHSGTGKPVSIVAQSSTTMDAEVIESLPVTKKAPSTCSTVNLDEADWFFDHEYQLDWTWWSQLVGLYPKLAELWSGQHEPENDKSPSGWRFAMISMLSHAGMEKHELVNLTLWWMLNVRKYDADQCKIDRPDIWEREMLKCEVKTQAFDIDSMQELIEDTGREKQLAVVADQLGFEDPTVLLHVTRIPVMVDEEEIANMIIRLHVRALSGEEVVVTLPKPLNRALSQEAIWAATGIAFPHYHGKQATIYNDKWRKGMYIAWHIALELDAVESDLSAQLLRALVQYVMEEEPAGSLEEARQTGRPCMDDGDWIVPTAALNSRVSAVYPDLRSSRNMHRAVLGLWSVGVQKVPQMYKGVRMACLVVPKKVTEEQP